MAKTLTLDTVLSYESDTITQVEMTSITTTTSTIIAVGGSWVTEAVEVGDIVTLSNHGAHPHNLRPLTVTAVTATTLTVKGAGAAGSLTPLTADAVADSAFSLAVHTPVGNLTSIETPGPVKGETEVTDYDSTAREFLSTLPDNGEIGLSGFMNEGNDGQETLFTDANSAAQTTRNWRIDFTRQAVRFSFAGWVKSFKYTAGGIDDAYGFDGSIRVTGAVTKSAIP